MNSVLELAKTRKVDELFHFTTIENLMSILERGEILSRTNVDAIRSSDDGLYAGDYVEHIDDQRLDGLEAYINLSLSRPNWYLLEKYKARKKCEHFEWCMMRLDTAALGWDETLFAVSNAASRDAKIAGIKGGKGGFNAMFSDVVGRYSRSKSSTPMHFTTDIQAEVLVKDRLSIDYVKDIFFASDEQLATHKASFNLLGLENSKFSKNSKYFESPIFK